MTAPFVAIENLSRSQVMQLSPDAIKDFKSIYRTEYGVELSDAEAETMARDLLMLFQTIARALPPEHAHSCPLHRDQPPSPSAR